jgi:hypothetical protein
MRQRQCPLCPYSDQAAAQYIAMGQKQTSHGSVERSQAGAGNAVCGSSLIRPPIPKDAHHTVIGRDDRQSDEFRFGSKNRSAKTNAATEVLATASCLGAFHEENPSAGPVPVGSSLKQCHFFARKASSGSKRSVNRLRRDLQLSQLHLLDELRIVRSMCRPMHC